jgi:hypothetical protein
MNMFKQRCLVLSATPYAITDKATNQTNTGLSVFYLTVDDLRPTTMQNGSATVKGIQPTKTSFPLEFEHRVPFAPALYDIEFRMVASQLRAVMKPVDITYVGEAEMKLKEKGATPLRDKDGKPNVKADAA